MPLSSKTPKHLKPSIVTELQRTARLDFIFGFVLISVLIVISLFSDLDLIEKFYAFSRAYEDWQFDDIFLSLFWIGLGSVFYALRRMRDIKSLNREIIKQAYYDSITNLPNRTLVLDRLEKQLLSVKRYGGHVVVAFLDFNNFKSINDTYGHGVGDELIRQVGLRLASVVRVDETVARLGGDEFLLVAMFKNDLTSLPVLLSRIRDTQQKPFLVHDQEFNIKYSIGVAAYPFDGETADKLVHAADAAMYEAKRSNASDWVFHSRW